MSKTTYKYLVALHVIGIPAYIACWWFDVVPNPGFWWLPPIIVSLSISVYGAFIDRPVDHEEPFDSEGTIKGLALVVPIVTLIYGLGAVFGLTGPNAYQFETRYDIAQYRDPLNRFEFDYPRSWTVLTPEEATQRLSSITTDAVIFVGVAPEWLININVQSKPTSVVNGVILGQDEDDYELVARSLRDALREQNPDASVSVDEVGVRNDRPFLRIEMIQSHPSGQEVTQYTTMVVVENRQLAFTTTAPSEVARGLNLYRFATVIDSFRIR